MRELSKSIVIAIVFSSIAGTLSGCAEEGDAFAKPPPVPLDGDAVGYYCNMIVEDHSGPKGQVLLPGRDDPLWFSSVRDTLAFTMLPEEPKNALAIYVTDMGRASWDQPEPDTWIDAREAWYVVGSSLKGGMGAAETVPFAQSEAAQRFAARYGGHVLRFGDVPESAVLGPGNVALDESSHGERSMHEQPAATGTHAAMHDDAHSRAP